PAGPPEILIFLRTTIKLAAPLVAVLSRDWTGVRWVGVRADGIRRFPAGEFGFSAASFTKNGEARALDLCITEPKHLM
ncbi:MAG TPA: hypothetical protein VGN39_11505, partial [Terriglobales bacterium]|nr:hypothetical protein [Terriglobales bacterium]